MSGGKPRSASLLLKLAMALAVSIACLGLLEWYARGMIREDFSYFKVTDDEFPRYRLQEEYASSEVTIKEGRREATARGARNHKLIILGDSVAFGWNLEDDAPFAHQLAAALSAVRGPRAPPVVRWINLAPAPRDLEYAKIVQSYYDWLGGQSGIKL